MPTYANIIVDISHEQLDKTFQYKIPDSLQSQVGIGSLVFIPFGRGNRMIKGYVIELTDKPEFDPNRMKDIADLAKGGIAVESQLIQLASWIKVHYGSTMIQALKTVMPIKDKVKPVEKKYYHLLIDKNELNVAIAEAKRKKYYARVRLLEAFLDTDYLPKEIAVNKLNISSATVKPLINQLIIEELSEASYRNPVSDRGTGQDGIHLNQEQQTVVNGICTAYDRKDRKPCLIHGITGSGKTEVYMEIIAHFIEKGKQAIVLIPEIALTYQTVMRFYKRFGGRVSMVNSKLSAGEKFDQFERARNGEIDVMIGPRSALFTPFPDLGLIIIDEEHESAYKSDNMPRYHARETAIERARISNGLVVMGSATPSLEAYFKAEKGEYTLYCLHNRAVNKSVLPTTHIVDLREELKNGNKSIFSTKLRKLILDRLEKREQIILFLNRRGYAGFISCRQCGAVIKCPHCDVSLTAHANGRLVCHYCGYTKPIPKTCPTCNSPYIAGFGLGTQKVEAMVQATFPGIKTLRMDMDTTSKKGQHQEILSKFSAGEADVLIGTQMIVKGHDFPNVTLVGILAADMSLYAGDYRAVEKTFQLITQAAGRAGRGEKEGDVVIQTYNPQHYGIIGAANQDYLSFYKQEMLYRKMLRYPPAAYMLVVLVASPKEEKANELVNRFAQLIMKQCEEIVLIGPSDAPVSKIKDIYRKLLYLKAVKEETLILAKDKMEDYFHNQVQTADILIQFDFGS